MRWTEFVIPTLKEDPANAESVSHRLLVRAGFIRMVSSGLYSFLPLGLRVLERIEDIIRDEMSRAGGRELLLPAMQPGELWRKSGRWNEMGPELIRFKSRTGRDIVLGPTHEEVITDLASNLISSYRDLPLNLYQIQTKFRDEARPRFGLIRAKEFIMKDAYSFDIDEEGLEVSYKNMYEAYVRIFKRMGISVEIVDAESGFMGGGYSQEFIAPSESGEDIVIACDTCSYRANREKAQMHFRSKENCEKELALEEVHTPSITTVTGLGKFLKIDAEKMIKTLIYTADDKTIAVLIRGDREVNETKLRRITGAKKLALADEDTIEKVTGGPMGFSGPVGLKGIKIILDQSIKDIRNAVTGANKRDFHLKNVTPGRDFEIGEFFDLSYPKQGDGCPQCSGKFVFKIGLELGHIFKLGTRYSEALGVRFLDKDGLSKVPIMGCYGIGVSRAMASIVEQNHDEDGIIWPYGVAPFDVLVLPVDMADEKITSEAERIYEFLKDRGYRVLMDDRPIRGGIKFKDADLIGIPLRINIGEKSLEKGKLELRLRKEKEIMFFEKEDLFRYLEEKFFE